MKSRSSNSLTNLFLGLTALVFIVLFITLSFHNRLASDDLYFLTMIKKDGLLGSFNEVYQTWSGRWTRTAYLFFVISLTKNYQHIHYFLFVYHLITLFVLVISIKTILRFLFLEVLKIELGKKDAVIYSVLFIASFYFFTFDIIESWWWICSSFAYLQGICFLLAGVALLLKQQQRSIRVCGIGFCFLYIGGCFEIYSLIVLTLFLFFAMYCKRIGKWNEWRKKGYLTALFIAFTCLLISTVICFIAPGNFQRIGVISDGQAIHLSSFYSAITIGAISLLQKKMIVAILLSSLWMLIGIRVRENLGDRQTAKTFRNGIVISIFAIIGSVLINEVFKVVVLKNALMPSRAFTFTSFLVAIFMCQLFFALGYAFFDVIKRYARFLSLIPCSCVLILCAYTYKQYGSTRRYAMQHDALIDTLLVAKAEAKQEILVHALPDPGMLVPLNVKDQDWALKEILDLSFEINVKN